MVGNVAILLGTLNGEAFLERQLASFEQQSFSDWRLFVSDDGSCDGTRQILARFEDKHGADRIAVREGPRAGFVGNFLSLACDPHGPAAYYAFSDQDDVWEPDKLQRAVDWLAGVSADVPALYCSRTLLIDQSDSVVGRSPLFKRAPSFRNALVQSVAGGNTMVFNESARRLAVLCGPAVVAPSHDWWMYLLVTGVGGRVHYDPVPGVRYRVHQDNVVGSNLGWSARVKRLRMLAAGRFVQWTEMNVAGLLPFRSHMTPENQRIFDLFCHARNLRAVPRTLGMARTGVYRQTLLGNIGLLAATVFKKI